jgi:hypothetical protein
MESFTWRSIPEKKAAQIWIAPVLLRNEFQ